MSGSALPSQATKLSSRLLMLLMLKVTIFNIQILNLQHRKGWRK